MKIIYFIITFLILANSATASATDADAKKGEVFYQAYCTQCHGINGDGWGGKCRHDGRIT